MVARALDALAAGTPVVAVLRASGCAPATFERRFRAACGLTPQRLRVLQRFGRALQIAHDGAHWAEAAAAAGYADQSHLSRDFRRHAGHTPSAWAAARTGWAQHMAWRG